MQTYIARLTDRGSLGGPIVWRTTSIASAREILVNVGSWQTSPDYLGTGYGPQILLGDSAQIEVFEDEPPFHLGDDLNLRVEDRTPYLLFSVGPRGGITRRRYL